MAGPYDALAGLLAALGVFGGLIFVARRSARKRPMHDRPGEIDAEPIHDYRAPGRKGEPLFAPGGVWFLVSFVLLTLLSIWFNELFRPVGEWVGDAIRRSLN